MANLLTIPMLKERFPDGGPSERELYRMCKRLGLGYKFGRKFYLSEGDWLSLWESAKEAAIGTRAAPSRYAKRMAGSRGSELRNQLEKSLKLERLGLLPTSPNTTTSKPTDRNRNQSPSQTRP